MSHIERFENQTDSFDFDAFSERIHTYDFERDWIEMIEEGEVFVHEGDLTLEGNLTDEEVEQSCTVIVFGNLTVSGFVDCTAFNLFVAGNFKATSVESGCDGHLSVDGDLEVDGYLHMSYNDTTTDVAGRFLGPFVFDSEHCNNVVEKVDPATIVFDLRNDDSDIIKNLFKAEFWDADDDAPSEAGYDAMRLKQPVLNIDVLAIRNQLATLAENTDAAVQALANIEGVGSFFHWKSGKEGATVLHDLVLVDASESDYQKWIKALVLAGVAIDAESLEGRYTTGLGTALHFAISVGNANAARAFSKEGANIDASEALSKIVLKPLTYMARYDDRFEAQELKDGLALAKDAINLAEELGFAKAGELKESAQEWINTLEEVLNKTA